MSILYEINQGHYDVTKIGGEVNEIEDNLSGWGQICEHIAYTDTGT